MTNPIYHDDPEWYERPGETVHLHVDEQASQFTVPPLPYKTYPRQRARYFGEVSRVADPNPPDISSLGPYYRCRVCNRLMDARDPEARDPLCGACHRAHARDTTAEVRLAMPKPRHARISSTEAWEVGSRWD